MPWPADHHEARTYAERLTPTPHFDFLVNLARAYIEKCTEAIVLRAERDQARDFAEENRNGDFWIKRFPWEQHSQNE